MFMVTASPMWMPLHCPVGSKNYMKESKNYMSTFPCGIVFHFTDFTHPHIHQATMFAVGNHCREKQVAESDTMVGRLQLNQQFLI